MRFLVLLSCTLLGLSEAALAKCSDFEEVDSLRSCLSDTYSVHVFPWSHADLSQDQVRAAMKNIASSYEAEPSLKNKEFREIWIGSDFFRVQDPIGTNPDPTVSWNSSPEEMAAFLLAQKTYPHLVRRNDAILSKIDSVSKEIAEASGVGDVRCLTQVRDNYACLYALESLLKVVRDSGRKLDADRLLVGNEFKSDVRNRMYILPAISLESDLKNYIEENIPTRTAVDQVAPSFEPNSTSAPPTTLN